ncbi:hypothetical protein FAZ69_22550 [Trinickia terrae]|uniref:Uncharacterized protein n=1 Tax=Trinickia terrae TaxID=2571161 RepID=A0A4U1HXP0_9BURK|nr:hypothetical protein [Trinickia terrae]TKC83816.1 hypothetical protein FAZ69_22550 [Trinickia terrae]
MLELTAEQVTGLAEIDARGYVERVRRDLVKENPTFGNDGTLPMRLWKAYVAAREFCIRSDENVNAFLRLEAYERDFYTRPATRRWLTRPGRSADERFHDYLRVMKWRIEHPEYSGGFKNGRTGDSINRGSSGGIWANLVGRWLGIARRNNSVG